MSDPRYDTEFWFNATLYTAYEWHRDFDTEAETREAFDTWLDSIRAEAWEKGYDDGEMCAWGAMDDDHECFENPYRD